MSEEGEHIHVEEHSNAGKWLLILLAVLFVAASAYAHYAAYHQVAKLSKDLAVSQNQVAELQNRMQGAEATEETLAHQVGLTKKELADRTAQVLAEQKSAMGRLEKQEQEQKAQISAVAGDVTGVKTDVGGVKTDVASTKADLEATKAKLESTRGDLGLQSGLIAKTQGDLDILKHKGDRNYYEFTLVRGAKQQMVSTVGLALRKSDPKKGKFTLDVTADDKTIEKKDRNVAEPIQFYSGREHLLFELVVWNVDKNKATGYLSTPKNAPVPVSAN
jgi:septal ring factor EnvC (AmiA/AmiB activator)